MAVMPTALDRTVDKYFRSHNIYIFCKCSAYIANTYYRRSVTDACGNIAYSDTLTVTLYSNTLTPGTIAASQTICSGTVPATLTSTGLPAGGDGNFVYQWQSSPDNIVWTNIAGATATTYSPAALSSTINYRRNVTDCGGTLTASSAAVTITVNQPPVITLQPANATACSGGNTSISVTVTGSGLTYQWQINPGSGWVNAANGPIYTGAKSGDIKYYGRYRCHEWLSIQACNYRNLYARCNIEFCYAHSRNESDNQ